MVGRGADVVRCRSIRHAGACLRSTHGKLWKPSRFMHGTAPGLSGGYFVRNHETSVYVSSQLSPDRARSSPSET